MAFHKSKTGIDVGILYVWDGKRIESPLVVPAFWAKLSVKQVISKIRGGGGHMGGVRREEKYDSAA